MHRAISAALAGLVAISTLPLVPLGTEAGTHNDYELHLRCDFYTDPVTGIRYPTGMESEDRGGRCGSHVGSHTWFVGDLGVLRINNAVHTAYAS